MKTLKRNFLFSVALAVLSCFALEAVAAPGPWVIHDIAKKRAYDGVAINLASDTLKVVLVSSASNFATTSVDYYTGGTGTTLLTNELATANGYTVGGATLTATWTGTATMTAASSAPVVWTASGGSITARGAVLVDTTLVSKPVIAHFLLDSTPADVTVTTGNTLTISTGTIFTLAYQLLYPDLFEVALFKSKQPENFVEVKQG